MDNNDIVVKLTYGYWGQSLQKGGLECLRFVLGGGGMLTALPEQSKLVVTMPITKHNQLQTTEHNTGTVCDSSVENILFLEHLKNEL